jgi:hypothetical protein
MKNNSMKTRNIISSILFPVALFCSSIFAEQREYFIINSFDEESEIPRAFGTQYYDAVVKHKMIYDLTFDEWFNGPHALASLCGARTLVESNGIIPVVSYIGNFASNPVGGISRGASNTSSVNLGLGIDLKELTDMESLKGWTIGNTWVWRLAKV